MKKSKFLGAKKIKLFAGVFMLALFTSNGCIACDCNGGMSNTGIGCGSVFRDTNGLIFVPMVANDGVANGIDVTGATTLDSDYFNALVNQTDVSKRWFPVASDGGIKDVEQVRAAIVTRTFTDGDDEFIRQGTKPFKGWLTGKVAQPSYAGKLESVRCNNMGVYKIDRGGNLIGSISQDGTKLNPIAISSGSFYATFMEATADKNNAYIEIGFNFAQTETDQTLKMIACNEFTDYRISSLRGLIDVCADFSNIAVEGVTVKLVTDQGTPLNPTLVQGITTIADWSFYNTTQSAPMVVTSVTESANGVYDIVFSVGTQPTAGDVITLTVSHDGYDFTCVTDSPFVIPAS